MSKTRRDILRERRDRQESKAKKVKKQLPTEKQTSVGFMKGGLIGGIVGLAIGVATKQKAFFLVAGFLTGGYIAENLKRMRENEEKTNINFVNYKKLKN